ncbi:PREDICTED: doublesex- and mab-3-related transcription factor C1-like [Chinchilla lanigera]|uniref:doublesex- and mab-3-related transcription factor C1-like n=1 Tax=Chinchilla lanigera TaxID=34839 RepID=UPI00038EDDDD|nr:PREDICTED: doublesex- and mab-3-related transcription factor C1-like [Chinchilla lanigera]
MAASTKSHTLIKNLDMDAEVLTEKRNTVPELDACPCAVLQEECSQGSLQFCWLPEPSSQAYTPATLEGQLTASLPEDPLGPPALPSTCSSPILQPCATPDPPVWQPQVLGKEWGPELQEGPSEAHSTSDQASIADILEWERKLEAAEALLALKNSSSAPPDAFPLQQPCSPVPLEMEDSSFPDPFEDPEEQSLLQCLLELWGASSR